MLAARPNTIEVRQQPGRRSIIFERKRDILQHEKS